MNNIALANLDCPSYGLPVSTMLDLAGQSCNWRIHTRGSPKLASNSAGHHEVSYYDVKDVCSAVSLNQEEYRLFQLSNKQIFDSVHGGRNFHKGLARTMASLDKKFPGHGIPSSVVADWIASCTYCQKWRLHGSSALKPMTKAFNPAHSHSCVAADGLEIGPDEFGNRYLMVFVNLLTKHTKFYACKDKSAESLALCMLQYACTFGFFDEFRSDPGSDFTSSVVAQLNEYLGQHHVVTHVNRPQANGVERTNGKLLYYMRAITSDLRFRDRWSSPLILSLTEYMVNSDPNSETEVTPFRNTFGTLAELYAKLPRNGNVTERSAAFIKTLDADLDALIQITKLVKVKNSAFRAREDPVAQNICQPGDYVLIELNDRPHKLLHRWAGPFKVLSQTGNDVSLEDLVSGKHTREHCVKLKRFIGSDEDAIVAARMDTDQVLIDKLLSYTGEPVLRTTMKFLVRFIDGDEIWKDFDTDLSETIQFEQFCNARPELSILLVTARDAKARLSLIRRQPIDLVSPGDVRYVDLRAWSEHGWFDELNLPDSHTKTYVLKCEYGPLSGSDRFPRNSIRLSSPAANEFWPVDNVFVTFWGHQHRNLLDSFILVDEAMILQYPDIMS